MDSYSILMNTFAPYINEAIKRIQHSNVLHVYHVRDGDNFTLKVVNEREPENNANLALSVPVEMWILH